MIVLKISVFPGLNHFIWSGPQNLGPDRKFLVRTTFFWCTTLSLAWNVPAPATGKSGLNHGFWFKPECAVWTRNSGLNQLPIRLKRRSGSGSQHAIRVSTSREITPRHAESELYCKCTLHGMCRVAGWKGASRLMSHASRPAERRDQRPSRSRNRSRTRHRPTGLAW